MISTGSKVQHISGWVGYILGVNEEKTKLAGKTNYDVKKKLKGGTELTFSAEDNLTILISKKEIVEWTDPLTGKQQSCPAHYVAGLQANILKGSAQPTLAAAILKVMGEPVTESNKRHIRAASLYLRKGGFPVLSIRSGEGGYFVAENDAEIQEYVAQQRKYANAMLAEAQALLDAFGLV